MKESNEKFCTKAFNLGFFIQKPEIIWCGFKAPNPSSSLHLKRMCTSVLRAAAERSEVEQVVVHEWALDSRDGNEGWQSGGLLNNPCIVDLVTGDSPGRRAGWREVHAVMHGVSASSQWNQGVCFLCLANYWLCKEGGKDWGNSLKTVSCFFLWNIWSQSGQQARSLISVRTAVCVASWHTASICCPKSLNGSLLYNNFCI